MLLCQATPCHAVLFGLIESEIIIVIIIIIMSLLGTFK